MATPLTPHSESALRAHILECVQNGRTLRLVGSRHSTRDAISSPGDVLVSLEHLRSVIHYDGDQGVVQVQSGITLGPCPKSPDVPFDQTLCGYLRARAMKEGRGWALPALGGITHQTVGGFLATGSAGGSTQHSFGDAVSALSFLDGSGNMHHVHRGEDLFDAVAVSMGLLGVITRVTFRCEPWFDIIGRETTSHTADCEIDLFGDGENSLREFLTRTPYARLLWWPQPGVDKMTVWQARRMTEADYQAHRSAPMHLHAQPYEPVGTVGQLIADAFYTLLGLRFGNSLFDRALDWLVPEITPAVINAFVPINRGDPTLFWNTWHDGLPMDNTSSDTLMPTAFTELWIPIDRTREVMIALRDHYRDNGLDAAGTYACEIYAAKRSPSWLSPAYAGDVVRVDLFWFSKNRADPCQVFYPQFWTLLSRFGFRPHWGKSLPGAGSPEGAAYLRAQYPQWDRFMELRDELDPKQIFVSDYWRQQLAIAGAEARARRVPQSMTVPRADESAEASEPLDRVQSG